MPDSDDAGNRLWQHYTRDVRPLKGTRRAAPAKPVNPERKAPAAVETPQPARRSPPLPPAPPPSSSRQVDPPQLVPGVASGVDKRTLQRLKRGLIVPEAQIDLHRLTQDAAHAALSSFLASSQAAGRRCVLAITGKGYGSEGRVGVLKTSVPRWLNEPELRARVLAFSHATAAFGGEGALFVLLRRRRK